MVYTTHLWVYGDSGDGSFLFQPRWIISRLNWNHQPIPSNPAMGWWSSLMGTPPSCLRKPWAPKSSNQTVKGVWIWWEHVNTFRFTFFEREVRYRVFVSPPFQISLLWNLGIWDLQENLHQRIDVRKNPHGFSHSTIWVSSKLSRQPSLGFMTNPFRN